MRYASALGACFKPPSTLNPPQAPCLPHLLALPTPLCSCLHFREQSDKSFQGGTQQGNERELLSTVLWRQQVARVMIDGEVHAFIHDRACTITRSY